MESHWVCLQKDISSIKFSSREMMTWQYLRGEMFYYLLAGLLRRKRFSLLTNIIGLKFS